MEDETTKARAMGKKLLTRAAKRRLTRALPVVGFAFAALHARQKIKTKGYMLGGIDAGLDLMPVVGRTKAVYEFFRGDLIAPELDEDSEAQ